MTMHSQRIVQLMQAPKRDVDWLVDAATAAVELEMATIPPYLCARWSITDSGPALTRVREVVLAEMAHMGTVCNLLKGLGVSPDITGMAPRYPGPLPGGVRPELTIYLAGFSRDFLENVMKAIEKPEEPLVEAALDETFTSVGAFYLAIAEALEDLKPKLDTAGQLVRPEIGISVLADAATAADAMDRIREQGEGTSASPQFDGTTAHYYRFLEIDKGLELLPTSDGKLHFSDVPVPFPAALPMARVPPDGWANRDPDGQGTLQKFNDIYRRMLEGLKSAWSSGGQQALDDAVSLMRQLSSPARKLMHTPYQDGMNYGPDFFVAA
jgi:hypothetical protein